jgi:hypothetical protein
VNTRNTSDQQAEENRTQYEASKALKQQKREQRKMASNLSTQILLKNIPPVDKFTGTKDQDPLTWLQDVEELFDATKTDKSDRRRLLPMCFGEDVKKWYRSVELDVDYDRFKAQFLKAFTSPAYKLQMSTKLINRRQGNSESVQSYYFDIISLCNRFNQHMQEDEKMVYLLRGLKPSIQQRIIINDPQNCQDLLEQAKRIETTVEIVQPQESAIDETISETTAALRRTTINTNNRQNNDTSWNNEQYGQYDRQGSQRSYNQNGYSRRRQQSRSSQLICYNCNGAGHYSYQCPHNLN